MNYILLLKLEINEINILLLLTLLICNKKPFKLL